MGIFIDEEGPISYGLNDWIILNTRETLHKIEPLHSKNPLIIMRFLYLKKQALKKDFPWHNARFNARTKTVKSTGCSLKPRDQALAQNIKHGLITFEEVMKTSILKFTQKQRVDIMFVFENGWTRRISFENGEIVSSRLTLLTAKQTKHAEFIIADDPFSHEFENALSSAEFGEKIGTSYKTLKEIACHLLFLKEKDIFIPKPAPDFAFSIDSFHGKKRLWRQGLIFGVMLCVYAYYEFSAHLICQENDQKNVDIQHLQKEISTDEQLKRKKDFLSLSTQKHWDTLGSPLEKIKDLKDLTHGGFYAQMIKGSKGPKMMLTLRPTHVLSQHETLQKFASLEKNLKLSLKDAKISVLKPPYGLEKLKVETNKKPSVTAKIEIVWKE